ncbi:MAG: glycoside hydrolase family 78 protein, partial [Planctomycetota bacterium]
MKRSAALLGILLALANTAHAQVLVDHSCVDAAKIPKTYLDQVRSLDIFFVHASVGMGMLSGLRALGRSNPTRYTLTMPGTGTAATWFDTGNGLIDNIDWSGMGGNGNPLGKIKGFDDLIRNKGYGSKADIAFFKFCYIDFGLKTNVNQIWTAYRDTMLAVEKAYPKVTFVWLTAALHALGAEGSKRAAFNAAVRDYCRTNNRPLFDLAAIESHDPDGNMARDDYGHETIYSGYTDDNGHLASKGRERVASAMWWLFARIAGWPVRATALRMSGTTPVLAANGVATTEITASLYDIDNAMFIRNVDRKITFAVTGPGAAVVASLVETKNGTARFTYRAGTTVGAAFVVASATGLLPDQLRINLIANQAPVAPTGLVCNGKPNPTAVPNGHPALTWTFQDPDTGLGDRQSAYQIILADNPTDIGKNNGNVWDSGKVRSAVAAATPAAVPLRPGVVYFWKVRTWDASAAAGGFSPVGTFTLANNLGFAARTETVTGKVDLGTHTSLDIHGGNATGLTIDMWLYRTESGRATLLLDRFVLNGGGYRVGIDASDHVYFRTRGKKDRRVTAIGVRLPKGQWHHVLCQTAGAAGTIYIDGVQQGRNGLIQIPNSVGNRSAFLAGAGALVDELRISDVQRYTASFKPTRVPLSPDKNTRGLWHFDEGMGRAAQDASGNGNVALLDAQKGWGAGTCACPGYAPPLVFYTGKATPGGTLQIKVVGKPSEPVLLGISLSPAPLDPPL